jgi:hypothetical protein
VLRTWYRLAICAGWDDLFRGFFGQFCAYDKATGRALMRRAFCCAAARHAQRAARRQRHHYLCALSMYVEPLRTSSYGVVRGIVGEWFFVLFSGSSAVLGFCCRCFGIQPTVTLERRTERDAFRSAVGSSGPALSLLFHIVSPSSPSYPTIHYSSSFCYILFFTVHSVLLACGGDRKNSETTGDGRKTGQKKRMALRRCAVVRAWTVPAGIAISLRMLYLFCDHLRCHLLTLGGWPGRKKEQGGETWWHVVRGNRRKMRLSGALFSRLDERLWHTVARSRDCWCGDTLPLR